MTELSPCPFCGVHLRESEGIFGPIWGHPIVPADCPIDGAIIVDAEQWNRRASPSPWRPDREAIARIIDGHVFKIHAAMVEYGIAHGETEGQAREDADYFHKGQIDEALAKADAIIALQPTSDPYPADLANRTWDSFSPEERRRAIEFGARQPPSGGVELEALKQAARDLPPRPQATQYDHELLARAARAYAASVEQGVG